MNVVRLRSLHSSPFLTPKKCFLFFFDSVVEMFISDYYNILLSPSDLIISTPADSKLSFSSSVCMPIVFISVNTMHAPAAPMKEFIHRHHYLCASSFNSFCQKDSSAVLIIVMTMILSNTPMEPSLLKHFAKEVIIFIYKYLFISNHRITFTYL